MFDYLVTIKGMMIMLKNPICISALVIPLLILSGCGGGGSKTPAKGSETPSSSSAASSSFVRSSSSVNSSAVSSVVTSSSIVASSVVSSALSSNSFASSQLSSVASSISSANSSAANNIVAKKISGIVELKDVDGSEVDITDSASISITISLLNDKDEVVDSKSLSALNSLAQLNDSLPFNGEVSGVNGKFLVVHISKEGFTDYARRFDVASELNIKATLSQVPSQEINATTAVTVSGKAVNGFNFSVTDKGEPVESGNDNGVADLTVSIPKSALPEGTTSIDVKMQAFNPNDVKDAEYFPGAYADSQGNKLLSVAFNYTDITTNTGVSLKKMAAASKNNAAGLQKISMQKDGNDPIVINRKIPAESCVSLKQLGDSSKELAGFQVPVYTYNPGNGLWDLIGQGTLYSEDGSLVADSFKDFDCASTSYVLEVNVTNEIFISNWWNLDYPLVFSQPVKMCADIQLVDEASTPVSNSFLFVHDDDDTRSFSSETYVTDEKGIVHIETFSLDSAALDNSAELVLYSKNYLTGISKPITLSTSCAVSSPTVVKVALPAMCKIEGKIKDVASQPVADAFVYAQNFTSVDTLVMPAFSTTDASGKYSLDVLCNQEYSVFEYLSLLMSGMTNESTANFNATVNNSVNGKEVADNGKKAVMQDLIADYSKPFGYVFSDTEEPGKLTVGFIYAGNAYPLTYSFDVMDVSTNKVYGHFSGTLTKNDLLPEYQDQFPFPVGAVEITNTIAPTSESIILSVKGEISDSAGKKGVTMGFIFPVDDQ